MALMALTGLAGWVCAKERPARHRLGILLSPILAATAISLSSVSVILNALRLRRVRL